MPKVSKVTSLQYYCNISRKVKDKYDFLHGDKHQNFLQSGVIVSIGHSHSCPKYSKYQDFLHANKHQLILQVETINLGGHGQARPIYPK